MENPTVVLSQWQFALTTIYSFLLCASHAWLGNSGGSPGDDLRPDRSGSIQADDPILGQAVCDQLCHGCSNGHCPGISIWHELVRILRYVGDILALPGN